MSSAPTVVLLGFGVRSGVRAITRFVSAIELYKL